MSRDLNGQVILITGASSGIGAETAVECARQGMDVVLGARRLDKLQEVCKRVEALGRKALPVQCDVESGPDVKTFVDKALDKFGRIDIAYANAGYGVFKAVLDTSEAEARAIFETNFWGTIRVIREATPAMLKSGRGQVVICSSVASEIAPALFGYYSATKAAQDMVASALRAELFDKGIVVTSIHPIGTNTNFFKRAADFSAQGVKPDNTPVWARHTPESVARAIVKNMKRTHPRPEVWPGAPSRFAMGMATMFPGLTAFALRRMYRKLMREAT